MTRKTLLLFTLLTIAATGCKSIQPAAQQGHDLLDNPGRSALIRAPAGLGAIAGHLVAFPISVILFPTWFFEGASVESCDVLSAQAGAESRENRKHGDMHIPLVQAPFEYGSGLGAAIIAQPLEWIAGVFRDPPGPPPGQIAETQEPKPGEKDPGLCFEVHPPTKKS